MVRSASPLGSAKNNKVDYAREVQGALDFSRLLPKGRKNAVWQARLANAEPQPSLVPATS